MIPITILLADNDTDYLNTLAKHVLEPEGYRVLKARSHTEVKEILRRDIIHLAILDVRLENDDDPYDRTGLDLCIEIDRIIPRILHTAYSPVQEIKTSFPNKVRFLHKDHYMELYLIDKKEDKDVLLKAVCKSLEESYEIYPKRRLALLTSGGDSPGMNAAIWSVVRMAMHHQIEVLGIKNGYRGLVEDQIHRLRWNDVSDIMVEGGTILGTARFKSFEKEEVRKIAVQNLLSKQVDGLIIIGGDGSMKGAQALANDMKKEQVNLQTVAIPGTIDNDLWGSNPSLGADSAANAMIEVMRNMLRPAQALNRIFICEVMGRYCGYLALAAALGIGADAVIIPEKVIVVRPKISGKQANQWKDCVSVVDTEENFRSKLKEISLQMEGVFSTGKNFGFIVIAEGINHLIAKLNADYVRQYLEDRINDWNIQNKPDVRVHIVGYPIRGVPPSLNDIWLGVKLGEAAVNVILEGRTGVMVGYSEKRDVIQEILFDDVIEKSNCSPAEIWAEMHQWQDLLELLEDISYPPNLGK